MKFARTVRCSAPIDAAASSTSLRGMEPSRAISRWIFSTTIAWLSA
jgi:hypothetical protein